ncbi:MAG: hypothetical protein C0592_02385 [Marinilabiliales bacterium]|nr:MAG: hypothetical protein C0592_02385 [Marinilabiliales bacterium]
MKKLFTLTLSVIFAFSLYAQNTGLASSQMSAKQKSDNSAVATFTKKALKNKGTTATNYIDESFATAIPVTWTVTTTSGTGWFWDNGSQNGYGQGCALIDSDLSGGLEDGFLTSPTVNTSGATALILEYNYNFQKFSTNEPDSGWVEVYNGSSWVWVMGYHADSPNDLPQPESIDVTAYSNANFAVRFGYTADYCWHFEISDVLVFEPDADDVGTASIDFGDQLTGAFDPTATVQNYGSSAQSFDVTMNITPGGYTSTQSVTSLAASATQQVTFANWNPTAGTYTVQVYTSLATDSDHNNDTLTAVVEITDLSYTNGTIYGYNAYDASSSGLGDYIVTVDKGTGAQTGVALASTNAFLSCGDYVDNTIYGVEYGTATLYIVNGNGMTINVGAISGVTDITGFAHDALNDIVYLADYNGVGTDLYTLDIPTLTATMVGNISATNLMIGIAAGNAGELWAIDLISDSLVSINTTTGAGTFIGPLGVDINYAQDIGFDRENAILYGTLYTTEGGLYTIDVATAAATLVGTFTDEISMCAVAANAPVGINETQANTFTMYPNPADNMITINVDNDAFVTISDLAGRIVYTSQINTSANISVADYNSGIYFVTVLQNNQSETIKLIVE